MVHQSRGMHLTVYFTAVLLGSVWADGVKVRGREGTTVTLEIGQTGLQKDDQILWMYGRDGLDMRIANLNGREIKTDYIESFRDRLQLDSQTGSLTITALNVSDCGVYQGQIIGAKISSHRFNLTVYGFVSPPYIKVNTYLVSVSCSSLTVECTVENGREVILSWYRGEERLSQTSSPDLSAMLSLPLEIRDHDGDIYSCVAKNPVDEKTTKLHTEETCLRNGESTWCCQTQTTVRLVVSAVVGVALIVLVVDHFRPRRCPKQGP
ncbi:hepatic and glial cell adhesion molecule-like [Centroberyx gerrardi]|uniref:hepatic and glial cell adhesion molecule-like n=1 Tax=Centroberyx gerrardi TaxID=166262 RepID=UPI003AADBC55